MWNYTEPRYIIQILTLLSGIFLSYQDIRTQSVNVFVVVLYITGSFLTGAHFCIWPLVVFACLGTLGFLIKKRRVFGEADYAVVFGSSFWVDIHTWPLFIALCGAFGIITSLIFRGKTIPFVPSIIASAILSRVTSYAF
jgi:hypothetical protein